MPPKRDLYEILGVSRTATQDEIRKAYLKLAHTHHPDKTGGDKAAEQKLKEINQAYDILKNPDKRSQYDTMGSGMGGFGSDFSGFGGFGGGQGFEAAGFDDLFDVLFGRGSARGGGRRQASVPGNDLEYRMAIDLEEAAEGIRKTIRFQRMENCPDCKGTGAASGSQAEVCPDCRGAGQLRRAQGFFSISQTCPRCRGQGRVITKPCKQCTGGGRVRVERTLEVELPAGIDSGQRLRYSGEGEPGDNGGPRGDLYIFVEVQEHDFFTREGNDITCEVPVSFPQAALGATLRVPTLKGEAELKIPPGTQSGKVFRMRNLGIPDIRGYRKGDQLVSIHVEVPTKLSREQRELVQKLQEISDVHSYPLHKRFMDRLKQSFS